MKLTSKLLGYLNRWVFDTSPDEFLAIRIQYDGGLVWAVDNGVLTLTATGGSGTSLSIELAAYTLAELSAFIAVQAGYSVPFQSPADMAGVKATVLVDGTGNKDTNNGDHLYGYTSIAYAYIEAYAVELDLARTAAQEAVKQITTATASNEWLDEVGDFFGVKRLTGESDPYFSDRIVYEVVRPRNNNKAIEVAISKATGGLPSSVTDVSEPQSIFPIRDGVTKFDSVRTHSHTGKYRRNLFDVEYQFDLEGADDVNDFRNKVYSLIDRFRSAGNHLRQFTMSGGTMVDSVTLLKTEALSATATHDIIDSVTSSADETGTYALDADLSYDVVAAPTEEWNTVDSVVSDFTDGVTSSADDFAVVDLDNGVLTDDVTTSADVWNNDQVADVGVMIDAVTTATDATEDGSYILDAGVLADSVTSSADVWNSDQVADIGVLADDVTTSADVWNNDQVATISLMTDSVTGSSDATDLTILNLYTHNGAFTRGGGSRQPYYDSGVALAETL